MAKYMVLEESYINEALIPEGTIVDFDGLPGSNLELVDEPTEEVPVKIAKAK